MHLFETGIHPTIPEDQQAAELWREGNDGTPVEIAIIPQTVTAARAKIAEMTSGMAHSQDYTIKGPLKL